MRVLPVLVTVVPPMTAKVEAVPHEMLAASARQPTKSSVAANCNAFVFIVFPLLCLFTAGVELSNEGNPLLWCFRVNNGMGSNPPILRVGFFPVDCRSLLL